MRKFKLIIQNQILLIIVVLIALNSCQSEKGTSSNETNDEKELELKTEDKNSQIKKSNSFDSLKESKKEEFIPEAPKYFGHGDPPDETSDPTFEENTPVLLPEKIEAVIQPEIYDFAEKMPEFPGGATAMLKYIQYNLKYPDEALQRKLEGIVYIKFIVHENGSLSDFKILKTPDKVFNQPSLAVLHSMPNWIPGERNGQKVKVYMTIPIRYKL